VQITIPIHFSVTISYREYVCGRKRRKTEGFYRRSEDGKPQEKTVQNRPRQLLTNIPASKRYYLWKRRVESVYTREHTLSRCLKVNIGDGKQQAELIYLNRIRIGYRHQSNTITRFIQ